MPVSVDLNTFSRELKVYDAIATEPGVKYRLWLSYDSKDRGTLTFVHPTDGKSTMRRWMDLWNIKYGVRFNVTTVTLKDNYIYIEGYGTKARDTFGNLNIDGSWADLQPGRRYVTFFLTYVAVRNVQYSKILYGSGVNNNKDVSEVAGGEYPEEGGGGGSGSGVPGDGGQEPITGMPATGIDLSNILSSPIVPIIAGVGILGLILFLTRKKKR